MPKHYWERHLPHWIPEDTPIFVTWRLAGTKPQSLGGPDWLQQPAIARIIVDALLFGETTKKWYRLHAWVVMPNHVHAVITPTHDFSKIMRWLKWTTATRCNQLLERTGP